MRYSGNFPIKTCFKIKLKLFYIIHFRKNMMKEYKKIAKNSYKQIFVVSIEIIFRKERINSRIIFTAITI